MGDLMSIDEFNKTQLNLRKPVVRESDLEFEWENKDLMPSLLDGVESINSLSTYTLEDDAVIACVNKLIASCNVSRDVPYFVSEYDNIIKTASPEVKSRLTRLKPRLVSRIKSLKGLVIFGEGGIGKTYFLYRFAEKLGKRNRKYIVLFTPKDIDTFFSLAIESIGNVNSDGLVLLIDAVNEIDDGSQYRKLEALIRSALETPKVSVVVTTRMSSPNARLDELIEILPANIEFEGVDPYLVFDEISKYPDDLFIQFQDVIFSRNPLHLKNLIAKFKQNNDRKQINMAGVQRTSAMEESIRRALTVQYWKDTKTICKYMYQNKLFDISHDEVYQLLGSRTNQFLSGMVEYGFMHYAYYKEDRYSFSSESQARYVIARSLNDDLPRSSEISGNSSEYAHMIACLISERSSGMDEHELCQVAIDRYAQSSPGFVFELIESFVKHDLDTDIESLLVHTIFGKGVDFSEVNTRYSWPYVDALFCFAGYLNSPYNLSNYSNEYFLNNQSELFSFLNTNFSNLHCNSVTKRIKHISEYVARTRVVPEIAVEEWLWLSIWCSASPNYNLRLMAQRLMFVICDCCPGCISEVIRAWRDIGDIYIKRAIAKTLSRISKADKETAFVGDFIESLFEDSGLTDFVTMKYILDASGEGKTYLDFNSVNIYESYNCFPFSDRYVESTGYIVDLVDLMFKNLLPCRKGNRGVWEFAPTYLHGFLDVCKEQVLNWNTGLRGILNCPSDGICDGLYQSVAEFEDFYPVPFQLKEISAVDLFAIFSSLFKGLLFAYGMSVDEKLFKDCLRDDDYGSVPAIKVLDIAAYGLMGSLASNYYLNQIEINSGNIAGTGFVVCDEYLEHEITPVHFHIPHFSNIIDSARTLLTNKVEDPSKQPEQWFEDTESASQQLSRLLQPIVIKGNSWIPLAMRVMFQIRGDLDLRYANNYDISYAYRTDKNINNSRLDRYLTIEHDTYKYNLKDYPYYDSSECLYSTDVKYAGEGYSFHPVLLPPPNLVCDLGLKYDMNTGCFVNQSGDTVICCDGNPNNYYEDIVKDLILIREEEFIRWNLGSEGVFFAFSERFEPKNKFSNNCERHWEIALDEGKVVSFPNDELAEENACPDKCSTCKFNFLNRANKVNDVSVLIDEPDDELSSALE